MKIKRSKLKQLALEFIGNESLEAQNTILLKIATARAARTSYTVVGEEDKPDNYEADIKLHDRLAAMGHWSPFEHCAKVMSSEEANYSPNDDTYEGCKFSGNFRGFIQYRKMFNNENITK